MIQQRLARNELEREPRPSGVAYATVKKTRDARVLQLGEDLTFAQEPLGKTVFRCPASHEFQRDLLFERTVGSRGTPDGAHATPAKHLAKLERTYMLASGLTTGFVDCRGEAREILFLRLEIDDRR